MTVTTAHAPPIEEISLEGRDGKNFTFRGKHLGHGTSEAPNKDRWFEVDVYARYSPPDDYDYERFEDYVVHTRGLSRIEGETTRARIAETNSPYDVVEVLTVVNRGKQYIPRQSARALAQAARWDDGIRDAYINRAVT